ncbi:MAG: T9SS type A sorting domain-containing protein [Saprospiraceae bacterium]|nr:T9SS type A sorting domain-containing protein [Saprospiraceae bacterium]
MKKKFTYLFIALLFTSMQVQAQRYLTEIFTSVTPSYNNYYATNMTVITGSPEPQDLYVDVYTPDGDTETARPLVLIAHTGSFLPIGTNGTTTGDTSDYAVVTIATRLAKMGYVAAIFSYRKGWNPYSTTVEVRRSQLINAAYKGVQDLRTVTRFFRKNVAEGGNTWGIDPDKIATWGQGTGGYITLASAFLTQEEIYISKFSDPTTGVPYVDTLIWGNIDATTTGVFPIPPFHVGYPTNVSLVFNAGGALGDSSWLDPGEIPVLSAHVIRDPYAPSGIDTITGAIQCEGAVIVPTNGDFVVNVAGSKCVVNRANNNGNNNNLNNAQFSDPITVAIGGQQYAEDNFWAIDLPGVQAGPWEFWNAAYWGTIPHPLCGTVMPPACSFHTINLQTNPDMSQVKADHYIDTLLWFFAPRANDILNNVTSTQEVLDGGLISVYPNPSDNMVWVEVRNSDKLMERVQLFDLQGRQVSSTNGLRSKSFEIRRNNLPPGMYLVKVAFNDGIVTKKVMFR